MRSATINMGLISRLYGPTKRTHMLAAFSAAVEGPLVMRFTRVTFGGVNFDFHKIGMEPRHGWWGVDGSL